MTHHQLHLEEVTLPSLTFQSTPIEDNVIFGWGGGGGGGGEELAKEVIFKLLVLSFNLFYKSGSRQ